MVILRIAVLAAFLSLSSGAEAAEGWGPRVSEPADQAKAWDAVGRLFLDETGFCTGALIDEELVLTAAHCLFNPLTGESIDPGRIEFRAGWRNGRAVAYRQVQSAVVHTAYGFRSGPDTDRVRHDVALLRLEQPIAKSLIHAFDTNNEPRVAARLSVVSYTHDHGFAPSLQHGCRVKAAEGGIVLMTCPVDFGASGAPVFEIERGRPRIVSVISAKAEVNGIPVSLGASLLGVLEALKENIARQPRFLNAQDRSRASGSTIVRP